MLATAIFIAAIAYGVGAEATPAFDNRTHSLALSHQYTGGLEHFVGGGVASFDCNGDLFPELYLAGGSSAATLLANTTKMRGGPVSLTNRTPKELAITGVTGAYPLDVDSDGILDLFIMRVGENLLLKGGPDCSFAAFDGLGFALGMRWTTAFSATWEKDKTLPTLAIGNYVDRKDPDGPFEACDTNFIQRPQAGQYQSIALDPGYCPLSMLFSDWGRNGRQDLRISNDRHYYVRGGAEQLWAMEDKPRLFSAQDGWSEFSIWGMGIASRDLSGDGLAEIFLTSMGDQKLQMLAADAVGPTYLDATYELGTTAHRPYTGGDGRPSTGWHVQFGDVDNDGLDDIFIAKGNVEQMPSSAMADPNNLLMQLADGSFVEAGLGANIASLERGRGASLVDLNLDGLLDLVVVNRRATSEVYQNVTQQSGNWLALKIHQRGINPRAVGAWIELTDGAKTWHREITVGGGHASGNATFNHFGVASASSLKVRMVWPDGVTSPWLQVPVNKFLLIERSGSQLTAQPL